MKKLFFLVAFFALNGAMAQDAASSAAADKPENPVKLNASCDMVSRYVWRGADYGASPSIQPLLSVGFGNFEVGAWGAFATTGQYEEYDPYIKFSSHGISAIVTDYFIPSIPNEYCDSRWLIYKNYNNFKYDTTYNKLKNLSTLHTFEGTLQYKGNEKFPLTVTVATMLFGNDKKMSDTVFYNAQKTLIKEIRLKNQYSTYLELAYTVKIAENNLDIFMGLTPMAGAYGSEFGVINAGVTGYRTIKISDKFDLPVKASLMSNPQASKIFFVFGFTL